MLFNTIDFAVFLPIVFAIYWIINKRSLDLQNSFVIGASYVFYGWWDWRFLFLIAFSSMVDFLVGLGLTKAKNTQRRKLLLLLSIIINIGFLGFFKYFNFFTDSFIEAFSFFGTKFTPTSLNIVLPVGISFYTFQTLSYTIDVYNRKLKATRNIFAFFAFVSFFPQLVAGPIERAKNLLPQFLKKRQFDQAKAADGMRQILWGLFKKVVIADNCAHIVNNIFANYADQPASTLFLGAILFSFQIYGDFSGYSDIAIGVARLFGINLRQNFAFPFFSRDIAEFWRRWHISLTTWFRDYVYIPMGGSKVGVRKIIRNIFVVFLLSGFWHGAKWTFIIWGLFHALLFLPLILLNKNKTHTSIVAAGNRFPTFTEQLKMLSTFLLFTISMTIFRSETVLDALLYFRGMLSLSIFSMPQDFPIQESLLILFLLAVEWVQRTEQHGLDFENRKIPGFYRWAIYYVVASMIIIFSGQQQEFIYFQF